MSILFLVAKILISAIFAYSGFNHLKNSEALTGYSASVGVPFPRFSVVVSGLIFLAGAFGIVLGVLPVISALAIAVTLVGATWFFHRGPGEETNAAKNVALIGALLLVALASSSGLLQDLTLTDPVVQSDNFDAISALVTD